MAINNVNMQNTVSNIESTQSTNNTTTARQTTDTTTNNNTNNFSNDTVELSRSAQETARVEKLSNPEEAKAILEEATKSIVNNQEQAMYAQGNVNAQSVIKIM